MNKGNCLLEEEDEEEEEKEKEGCLGVEQGEEAEEHGDTMLDNSTERTR